MKDFGEYFRLHRRGVWVFALFTAVFAGSFFLYRLPLAAVAYPAGLCAMLGAGLLAWDFRRFQQRRRRLREIGDLPAAEQPPLPPPDAPLEAEYQAVITALQEETADLAAGFEARNREMEEYYTVWVHQIKTPITAMRLSLQNEDTALSRKLTQELGEIERYVEMVLAYLRLDSRSSDYVFAPCALDGLIRQAVAKFAAEFIDRRLKLDYTPVEVTVVTDEKWLSFVVEQLLSNALKYTRQGGVSIYMEGERTLCIADTGIGIAPEDLPRVFEKGYTGANGRWDKKASGLGLYLCCRVCQRLGAELRLDSRVGEGTVARITLDQYQGVRE